MNAHAKMLVAIAGAERKFRSSRSQVVCGHSFFGAILLRQKVFASWDVETLCTTGKEIYYNPDFVDSLSAEHLQACIAHEALHPAFCHHLRRGNREFGMWNEACDYSINPILVEAGFHLPDGALLRDDMVGKSAETCYKILWGERQGDEQGDDDQQQDGDQGDDQSEQQEEQEEEQDREPDQDKSQSPPVPRPIESEQDDDGDAEGQDDGQSDDDQQGDSEEGDEDGEGDGAGDDADGDDADGDGAGAAGPGESGDGQQAMVPSFGGMGAVLDAPVADEAERAAEEEDWKVAVVQAVNFAKASDAAGDLPGDLLRQIDAMVDPRANWRELLRRFMTQFAKSDYSWSTPNRRHIADGLYLPSMQSEQLPPFLFVGDASGSMPADALEAAQAELQEICDEMHPEFVDVIFHDTRVTSVTRYEDGEEIELDAKGGGGTRFAPVCDWINDADEDYCVVVWFTDMYTNDWDQCAEPDVPVLFIDWTATHDDPHFGEDVIGLEDDWS